MSHFEDQADFMAHRTLRVSSWLDQRQLADLVGPWEVPTRIWEVLLDEPVDIIVYLDKRQLAKSPLLPTT